MHLQFSAESTGPIKSQDNEATSTHHYEHVSTLATIYDLSGMHAQQWLGAPAGRPAHCRRQLSKPDAPCDLHEVYMSLVHEFSAG